MASRQITDGMRYDLSSRCAGLLWNRTATCFPRSFDRQRFESSYFENHERYETFCAFVRSYPMQWNGPGETRLRWEPYPGFDFNISLIADAGKFAIPYDVPVHRYREPELWALWDEWLSSIRQVYVETLIGLEVISRVVGGNDALVKTTAQLRDTWPQLLHLDRTGRAADLRPRSGRPGVPLGDMAVWPPHINEWLAEGAVRGRDTTPVLSDGLRMPGATVTILHDVNRLALRAHRVKLQLVGPEKS